VAIAVTWVAVLVVLNVWVTFVLRQFAFTREWGERATEWMVGVVEQFAIAAAEAVPGLLMAILIFLLARLATRANGALMQRIERGEVQVTWLDTDTAGPTRRIGNFIIWLFALALAYPFLPGSNSDAFKGVSVLAGLMLSIGASSVVGQVMSGLALMYSRSLRVGEYVRIGDIEGTVTVVGLFAIKVHTGMGEEVSVPNSVAVGGAVHNYSRLAQGQFILHTAVTIGYSTPWRHVHTMLLEAARRTPGVAQEPAPYVVQTALSDFYVEYRLCAQSSALAPARRAEALSELHGHVQDVFNENGVQIMSPHYMAEPAQPQVVAPAHWAPPLAPAATPQRDGA
jgi:small-conductance mechanosensitive channel